MALKQPEQDKPYELKSSSDDWDIEELSGQILLDDYLVPDELQYKKVLIGGQWVRKPVKRFDGFSFSTRRLYRHNGTTFVPVGLPPVPTGPTVTVYRIDGSDGMWNPGGGWANPANLVDTDDTTYSSATTPTNSLNQYGTDAPASGGSISLVRARIKAWSPDDGRAISVTFGNFYTREFDYNAGLLEYYGGTPSIGVGGSASWSSWVNLTSTSAWTWTKLQELSATVSVTSGVNGNAYYAYKIEIEVTYA